MFQITSGDWLDYLFRASFSISFYILPALITLFTARYLIKSWEYTLGDQTNKIDKFKTKIGLRVGELLFNFMGVMTAYDPANEELMADVFTSDGYLYCGIYSDYFINSEGSLTGICISNAIRHRIAHSPNNGTRIGSDSYIIPNQGDVFSPQRRLITFMFGE